jgi:mannose-6-phosphate isomerase
VVRGGLTAKHVDVDELLRVALWEPVAAPLWPGVTEAPGVVGFHPPGHGFALHSLSEPGDGSLVDTQGPGIALGLTSGLTLRGVHTRVTLDRGAGVYISEDEFPLTASGTGRAVLATGQ